MSKLNLNNHYDCPLETVGLSIASTQEDIDRVTFNEWDDLEDNYGPDRGGVSFAELFDYLRDWVNRESEALRA